MVGVMARNVLRALATAPVILACPASAVVIAPVLWAGAYRDGKRHRERQEARSKGESVRESAFGKRVGFAIARQAALAAADAICTGGLTLPSHLIDAKEAVDEAL
jgi:hypothetical protein